MGQQIWNAEAYERNARFVSDLGMPVVALLSPRRGERILDLGCGDGALTQKLANLGCDLVGNARGVVAQRGRHLDRGLHAAALQGSQDLTAGPV